MDQRHGVSRFALDGGFVFPNMHSDYYCNNFYSSISSKSACKTNAPSLPPPPPPPNLGSPSPPLPLLLRPPLLPLPSSSPFCVKPASASSAASSVRLRSNQRKKPRSTTPFSMKDVSRRRPEREKPRDQEREMVISPPPSSLPLPSSALVRLKITTSPSSTLPVCATQDNGATDELRRLLRL